MRPKKLVLTLGLSVVALLPCSAQLPSGWEEIPTTQQASPSPRGSQPRPLVGSQTEPYSLKGITLGMTLEDFRRVRFSGREANLFPVCSCDRAGPGTFVTNRAGAEYGGITCTYHFMSEVGFPMDSSVTIAQAPCMLSFNFINTDGQYRLYEIEGDFHTTNYAPIVQSLEEKFGAPTKVEDTVVQNNAGATFPNERRLWFNGVSSIDVQKRFLTVDKGAIWFTHQELARARAERVKQRDGTRVQDL